MYVSALKPLLKMAPAAIYISAAVSLSPPLQLPLLETLISSFSHSRITNTSLVFKLRNHQLSHCTSTSPCTSTSSSSNRVPVGDVSNYTEAFARRMALAGLKPHHRIALGVSGGPDSMALCVLASIWKRNGMDGVGDQGTGFIDGLLAIIVDHNLRAESREEAYFVSHRVLEMGISCEIAQCEWSKGTPTKGHLQEAARERRYQIFHNICIQHQIGVLLVAHHADDQAELFILRLSRSSGVLGLAGMAFTLQLYSTDPYFYGKETNDHGILLVRPLLEFSKDDLYHICEGANREWVEDPTNKSAIFARNRIRLALKELSSSMFNSDVQAIISACRRTRAYVDKICRNLIDQSVSMMPQGYAIIDLVVLNPSNIEDLCLSKFVALVVQFISQRHKPVRSSALKLLMDYFRKIPCKESVTAASCYLCPAPGSKGTKIVVCCSVHSSLPLEMDVLHKLSYEPKHPLSAEISEIIEDRKSHVDHLIPDASNLHFLNAKSSESLLVEAKRLNILSDYTFRNLVSMQRDETERFMSLAAEVSGDEVKTEAKTVGTSLSETLKHGEIGYFMNRFVVKWKQNSENQCLYCKSCLLGQNDVVKVRHMVDADWLYLAKLSRSHHLENSEARRAFSDGNMAVSIDEGDVCSDYAQLSAERALMRLKSIPVAARRGLPVLDNSQGQLICIPSVGFKHCPCLTVAADFRPRVPLGGGHSSFI